MRQIVQTRKFKSDYKKIARSGRYNKKDFLAVVELLAQDKILSYKYRDHPLAGDWMHYRECHIKPDWLLIYKKTKDTLILVRTGSHCNLF